MAVCIDCFAQISNDTPKVSPLGARCVACGLRTPVPAMATAPMSRVAAVPAPGGPAVVHAESIAVGQAVLFGLAAAVVAGVGWYLLVVGTDVRFAYAAIGAGALIGTAVAFEQPTRSRMPLQALAVGLTLVTLVLAEWFILRHEVLGGRGPFLLSPTELFDIIRIDIENDPMVLLFWGASLVTAGVVPARR